MEHTELKTTEAAVTITHKDWCKAIRSVAKRAGKTGYESGISLRAKHPHLSKAVAAAGTKHWFSTIYNGEFYGYEVTVPPFTPPPATTSPIERAKHG